MNDANDALTQLLAGADPSPADNDATVVDRAWAAIEGELLDDPVVTPLRKAARLRRAGVVGAVAVVALAASAGAAFIATRTGEQNPPEWVSAGGPGEIYRLDGTDFASELAELAVDVPYPDEATRAAGLAAIVADFARLTEPAAASTGALRAELARGAICYWSIAWQEATTDDGRATAVTGLRSALAWPAVTDVDPKPAIDGYPSDGGPAPTVFGYLPGIIDAAASGDAAELADVLDESAYCAVVTRPPVDPATAARPRPHDPGVADGRDGSVVRADDRAALAPTTRP